MRGGRSSPPLDHPAQRRAADLVTGGEFATEEAARSSIKQSISRSISSILSPIESPVTRGGSSTRFSFFRSSGTPDGEGGAGGNGGRSPSSRSSSRSPIRRSISGITPRANFGAPKRSQSVAMRVTRPSTPESDARQVRAAALRARSDPRHNTRGMGSSSDTKPPSPPPRLSRPPTAEERRARRSRARESYHICLFYKVCMTADSTIIIRF